jgi:hypothetical protein
VSAPPAKRRESNAPSTSAIISIENKQNVEESKEETKVEEV